MLRLAVVALVSSVLAVGCASSPTQADLVRIDATSRESAEASYRAMMKGRSVGDRQKLALAVLMLNIEGVKSAYEVVRDPELQAPSVGRIKDKVAGLTADQIIELAGRNPAARIEVSKH